jgi:hypothetical protein
LGQSEGRHEVSPYLDTGADVVGEDERPGNEIREQLENTVKIRRITVKRTVDDYQQGEEAGE